MKSSRHLENRKGRCGWEDGVPDHPYFLDAGAEATELECPVLAPPQESDMVKSTSSEVGWVRIHFLALVWFPAMVVTLSVVPSDGGAGNAVLEEEVIAEEGAISPLWQNLSIKRA